MVKRFNRTLEAMLSNFVSENQKDWDQYLPLLMMAYHSSVHESTGFTPNEMMFGREVLLPLDLVIGQAEPSEAAVKRSMLPRSVSRWNESTNLPANT